MTIREWFNSDRDYETGRLLYEQFGTNTALKVTFRRGQNNYNKAKLPYELAKLSPSFGIEEANPMPIISQDGPGPVVIAPEIVPPQNDELVHAQSNGLSKSSEMEELERTKNDLYSKTAALHQQLEYMPTDEDRYAACEQIVSVFEGELPSMWRKIDYARDNGKLAEVVASTPVPELSLMSLFELVKERNNLRTRISKLKDPLKADKKQKLEAELNQVISLLNEKETEQGAS